MGKKNRSGTEDASAAVPSSRGSGGGSWFSAKQKRKYRKAALWMLGPLLAAMIALVAAPAPDPVQTVTTGAKASDDPTSDDDSAPLGGGKGPPPVDTWEKPDECLAWAGDGQCTKNPGFMLERCAFSCAKLDYARQRYFKRCPKPENYTATLTPGKMRDTFRRIMSGEFAALEPEMISEDPPVVLFHKFFSEAETDAFIRHGRGRYEKSLGVGMKADGTMGDVKTEIRTSSHGWCQHRSCLDDPNVQAVTRRVADLTQTPETNAEFAQLVYYHACRSEDDGDCAFYRRHNDYIDGDDQKLQGVRIYTLFGYMNDVPEGGATRFTSLPNGPVTFQPQRGKAILWPSVLADEPHSKDSRTDHEALPVTKGEKFGANFWIHQYDFKGPHNTGCTK